MNFSWGLAGVAGGVDLPLLGIFHQLHLLVFLRHGCSTVLFTLEWLALSPWEQILQLIQILCFKCIFAIQRKQQASEFPQPQALAFMCALSARHVGIHIWHTGQFASTEPEYCHTIESAFVTSYFLIRINELAVPARFVHQTGRMASLRAKHWQGWSKRLVWFQKKKNT